VVSEVKREKEERKGKKTRARGENEYVPLLFDALGLSCMHIDSIVSYSFSRKMVVQQLCLRLVQFILSPSFFSSSLVFLCLSLFPSLCVASVCLWIEHPKFAGKKEG